jgi:hypothetical protein
VTKDDRLRRAIAHLRPRARTAPPPEPEGPWARAIQDRVRRLETRQKVLLALSAATLATVAGLKPETIGQLVTNLVTAVQ